MNEVLSDYKINSHTMALLSAAHIEYDTIAVETNQELFIRKTPYQLISGACLENCSTYEGRREAIKHHFGIKRKVPIPINPGKNLFAFPTHSPTDFACNWIFHSHIQAILTPSAPSKNMGRQ